MESAPAEDAVLVGRLQAGDDSALSGLIERHQESLYYFVKRYLGNDAQARDAVQEVFVRAYFGIRRYRPKATFKTWLYAIAVNLCHDQTRKQRRQPAFVSLDEPKAEANKWSANIEPATDSTPAKESEMAERHTQVEEAIASLPVDLRMALLLFSLEGYSQKECAEMLGVTVKTIELRVYRAKKELQFRLSHFLT